MENSHKDGLLKGVRHTIVDVSWLPSAKVLLLAVVLLAACTHTKMHGHAVNASLSPAIDASRQTYYFECSDGYCFIARIEEEKAWLFLPHQAISLPHVPSEYGAKYSKGLTTFWSKGNEALLHVGSEKHRGCINNRAKAIWEDAKLDGVDFRAVGNEPGWHLEITAGQKIVFVGDYGQTRYAFATPEPLIDQLERTTTYEVKDNGHDLDVVLQGVPCRDAMSGEPFETTVTVILDGKRFIGCGKALH